MPPMPSGAGGRPAGQSTMDKCTCNCDTTQCADLSSANRSYDGRMYVFDGDLTVADLGIAVGLIMGLIFGLSCL
jgi:hypothetical protein